MATHAPAHSDRRVSSGVMAQSRAGTAALPRWLGAAAAAIAVWAAALVGFQLLSQHVFGFTAEESWALGFAVITYFGVFIGFVSGMIYLVNRADASFLGSGE
jgi:hypothetical protein